MNNLCYVDFRLGRLEEAQSYCAAALKLNADLVAAQNNMGLVYAAAGDFGEARRAFLAAGDEAAAEFNLGIVYWDKKITSPLRARSKGRSKRVQTSRRPRFVHIQCGCA